MKRFKNTPIMTFSSYDVERRTKKAKFYHQIDILINWKKINKTIDTYYIKGNTIKGESPYSGLVLFKMLLIGIWNNLSDVKLEDHLNDSLSAMQFCGLQLEDSVPDHSTISRFRTLLCEKKGWDYLLNSVNLELEAHDLILKQGVKVDASLTDSPFRPRNTNTFEIAEDRKEDEISEEQKELQGEKLKKIIGEGVDKEARFLSKKGRPHFGYKRHFGVDDNGIILGVHTTPANEHDSKGLEALVKKMDKKYTKKGIFTDKGYKTPTNDAFLKSEKIKNRIQHKAYRNRPLSLWQLKFNKLISKTRWVVERTFGGQVVWFGSGKTRYKGKEKLHAQHVMEAICYNLKRSPKLAILKAI